MERIKHKILVLSGKGGVGKSCVAVNLAVWLSTQCKNVGLLDIDIHGPSVPKLLNVENSRILGEGGKLKPVLCGGALKVMSIGFLLQEQSNALIWRGPMKHNVIKQFVTEVSWGELDYLVVDCPPGTGDEPLSITQLLSNADGAVIVTTPQQLSVIDVKKCITFCKQLNLPVLGVIENMSYFVCPQCNHKINVFSTDGGKQIAKDFKVPFLASIPLDPALAKACDAGIPFINTQSPTADLLRKAFKILLQRDEKTQAAMESCKPAENPNLNDKEAHNKMRIAIPLVNGRLSEHFGHCEQFVIIDADPDAKKVTNTKMLAPPAHEPGALPKWLSGLGVDLVIAGGMGRRAQQLFAENNIDVAAGAQDNTPKELAIQYLAGQLQRGENICDH